MSFLILVTGLGVCPLALFSIRHHVMGDAISVFSCNIFASFLFWSKFLQLKIVFLHIQPNPAECESSHELVCGSDSCSRIPDYYLVKIFTSSFLQVSIIRKLAGRQLLKTRKKHTSTAALLKCRGNRGILSGLSLSWQGYRTVAHFIGSYCSLWDICIEGKESLKSFGISYFSEYTQVLTICLQKYGVKWRQDLDN